MSYCCRTFDGGNSWLLSGQSSRLLESSKFLFTSDLLSIYVKSCDRLLNSANASGGFGVICCCSDTGDVFSESEDEDEVDLIPFLVWWTVPEHTLIVVVSWLLWPCRCCPLLSRLSISTACHGLGNFPWKLPPLLWGSGPPSNLWFLRPTRVHFRNGISISSAIFAQRVAAWLNGSTLVTINEVTLRRARLVLGWMTVFGWANHLGL